MRLLTEWTINIFTLNQSISSFAYFVLPKYPNKPVKQHLSYYFIEYYN